MNIRKNCYGHVLLQSALVKVVEPSVLVMQSIRQLTITSNVIPKHVNLFSKKTPHLQTYHSSPKHWDSLISLKAPLE